MLRVSSDMILDASPQRVFEALSDYDRFSELSSRYRESRFIAPAFGGAPRVYTLMEGCVWFFCRTVERVAFLTFAGQEQITATVEPELSDFEYGYEVWKFSLAEGGTRVQYTHDFDPEFWVPPVIGVWLMRRELENDALKAAQRIEALARLQQQ